MNFYDFWKDFIVESRKEQYKIKLTKKYEQKKNLNPELWKNQSLKRDILKKLLRIADDIFQDLGIPKDSILDLQLTGSNAGYNWTKTSDIDLHFIIDFSKVGENINLMKSFFNAQKSLWNSERQIVIKGHEVEVFFENSEDPSADAYRPRYSLRKDAWVQKPQKMREEIDWVSIRQKVEKYIDLVEIIETQFKRNDYNRSYENSKKLKQKLREYRESGLEKAGAFSVENIAFKVLRDKGYLEVLKNIYNKSYDQLMSVYEFKDRE